MTRARFAASCFLLLAGPLLLSSQSLPTAYKDSIAYEVYDAAIPMEGFWSGRPIRKKMAIQSETRQFSMCLEPDQSSKAILAPAIADYVEKNKTVWSLEDRFRLKQPHGLISKDAEIQHPEQYSQTYGGVDYLELSAVGFNGNKTIAVVYEGHYCGPRCGGGGFFVLQKIKRKWQKLKWGGIACTWAS